MVLIGQTVGVGKVRSGAAELLSALVHLLDEGVHRTAYVLGYDVAGLVCRGEQGAVQKVLKRHRLAGNYAGSAAVVYHALKAALAGRHAVGEGKLTAFHGLHSDQDGHDLRQGGGIGLGVCVLLIEYPAGRRVNEHGVRGAYLRFLQREGWQAQRGQQKAKE